MRASACGPATFGRSILLTLTLLSACAATDPSGAGDGAAADPGLDSSTCEVNADCDYVKGRYAVQRGDLDQGATYMLRALALDPTSPEVGQQAFMAALLAGRPEAVRLARENPGNAVAQLLLAGEDAKAGDWASAEKRYGSLSRQGFAAPLWPLLVAWSQFGAGLTDQALSTLHPYAQADAARQAIYLFHAGLMSDLAGRTTAAGRDYRAAQDAFGVSYPDMVRAVASWQARNGNVAEARQTLAALDQAGLDEAMVVPLLQKDPAQRTVRNAVDGLAESYAIFAAMSHQQDNNEIAAVLLRLALALRPDHTTARLLASEVLSQGSDVTADLAVLEPIKRDDPLWPLAELRRAQLQDRAGHPDTALRTLAQLETVVPGRPQPWALQGAILREERRWGEAVAAYDKAVSLVSVPTRGNWPLFYERGIAEERNHEWPKAEADFQRALQLSPNEPFVLNYLGYSWTEQGKHLAEAQRMIDSAAEARPNDGAIIDSKGWIALREHHVADAVDDLERAVELDPEDATVNGHLGDAYWAAGRKLEALYQWQRALSLNPEPDDVGRLRAKLREAELVEQPRGNTPAGAATAEKGQP